MKQINRPKKKQILKTFTLILVALMVVSIPSLFKTETAKAQVGSNVPSSLLQYDWPGVCGDVNTHFSAGPAPNSPDILWQKNVPSLGQNPIMVAGLVIITQGSRIVAMDGYTGNTVWNVSAPVLVTGRSVTVAYPFKIDNTHIGLIDSTASIYANSTPAQWAFICLNVADGSIVWKGTPEIGPLAGYKPVYVPEIKMGFCGAGNTTGKGGSQNPGATEAWDFSDLTKPPVKVWTYIGDGVPTEVGYYTYGDGKLFLTDAEPHQTCLDAKTGKVLWVTQLTGAPAYTGVYLNGALYRGCLDNTFIALDGSTGKVLWTYKPGPYGFWCSGVGAGYGMVYETNVDGNFYALNATTGNVVWKYVGPNAYYPGYTEVADGKVYVCTGTRIPGPLTPEAARSEFTCFDAFTGKVIWQVPREFISNGAGPSEYSGIAYGNYYGLEADQSTIYCYGPTKDWSMFGGDPAHTATGYGGPTTTTQKWVFNTGGAVISSPAVASGKVYIGSYDKNWYCLNSTTGAKIWNFTTGFYVRSSAAVVNGKVYTGADDGFVYCLDANTGAQLWKTPAPGQVLSVMTGTYPEWRSSPNVVNNRVYVGSLDCNLYCFDANTGSIMWTIPTTGAIMCTPTYLDGGLYFASQDGVVYKVDANSGSIIWKVNTPSGLEMAMEGSPCVGNGMVVIGSGAAHNAAAYLGQEYCLNATTGAYIWNYTQMTYTLEYFTSSPNLQPIWTPIYLNLPTIGKVFVFGDFYDMTCVNATNGKVIWTSYLTREHFGLPSYADNKLYVPADTFGIYVLNATSGNKLDYFEAGAQVRSSPAIYQSMVYFGCLNWNVYCIAQTNANTIYYGSPSIPAPSPSIQPTIEPTIAPTATAPPQTATPIPTTAPTPTATITPTQTALPTSTAQIVAGFTIPYEVVYAGAAIIVVAFVALAVLAFRRKGT